MIGTAIGNYRLCSLPASRLSHGERPVATNGSFLSIEGLLK